MNQTRIPKSGDFYKHFKEKLYQIISVAEHSETGEPFVVYQALYGQFKTYIRPLDMFLSEVDREKYPEVKQKYRFTQVGNNHDQYLADAEKIQTEAMIEEVAIEEVAIEEVAIEEVAIEETMIEEAMIEEVAINKAAEIVETVIDVTEEVVNPFLLEFLDADTFGEKLEVLRSGKSIITDRLINDLAVVLDVVIEEGQIEQRYDALKSSLETFQRYECTRFQRR